MKIIPAIDLMDGQCVRLKQGDYSKRTNYEADPMQMTRLFERMGYGGCTLWIWTVLVKGHKSHEKVIRELIESTSLGFRWVEAFVL